MKLIVLCVLKLIEQFEINFNHILSLIIYYSSSKHICERSSESSKS